MRYELEGVVFLSSEFKCARFGTAGNSDAYSEKFRSNLDVPEYIRDYGLDHYEYQCGRGAKVTEKFARGFRPRAEAAGITLSLHAPYYISLSGIEAQTREKSIGYIIESCESARRIGAERIVIHSGSCAKLSRDSALALARDTLSRARRRAIELGYEDIIFCPETMGKVNQLGDLEEVLELCSLDETFLPTIDFGHLNARTFGGIKTAADYEAIFDAVENRLGFDRLKVFHSHFSKIMFTEPGGEKKHVTFDDNKGFGPDFEPLMEIIAKRGLTPIIVCESAGTQDKDALTMKKYYEAVNK